MRRTLQNIAEQMQNICRTFAEHLQNMGTPGLAGEMQNSDASPFRKDSWPRARAYAGPHSSAATEMCGSSLKN